MHAVSHRSNGVCVKFTTLLPTSIIVVLSRRLLSAGDHQIFTTRKRRRFSLARSKGHAFCVLSAIAASRPECWWQQPRIAKRTFLVMNMQMIANVTVIALITINRLLCQLCPATRARHQRRVRFYCVINRPAISFRSRCTVVLVFFPSRLNSLDLPK